MSKTYPPGPRSAESSIGAAIARVAQSATKVYVNFMLRVAEDRSD
jgi:hypothetical protein